MTTTSALKQTGVSHIVGNSKYPDFIRKHIIFSKLPEVKKVFPSIGLPNCSQECIFTVCDENILLAAQVLNDLRSCVSNTIGLDKYYYPSSSKEVQITRAFLRELDSLCRDTKVISTEDGKIVLRAPYDSNTYTSEKGVHFYFKKGESLFKIYNRCVELTKIDKASTYMGSFENFASFKQFSASNIPGDKKYTIHFSSEGEQGAWDIATMSMRGISSCQSWGTPQSHGLIGSISSRFVGVVYITDGKQIDKYGSKTIRRAVVRYCINKSTKEPALLVDRVYPNNDTSSQGLIRDFLEKRSKLKVIFATDNPSAGWNNYYLPKDREFDGVEFKSTERTYMDTPISGKITPITTINVDAANNRAYRLDTEIISFVDQELKLVLAPSVIKANATDKFDAGVSSFLKECSRVYGISYSNFGRYITLLSSYTSMSTNSCPLGKDYPQYRDYYNIDAYEMALIKYALRNSAGFKKTYYDSVKTNIRFANQFFPKSLAKITELVHKARAKYLLQRYSILIKKNGII